MVAYRSTVARRPFAATWRRICATLATTLCTAALSGAAMAFPTQPIQLILSFPPGGATDVLARELSVKLGEELGQSIAVLNRPGAAGLIGMQAAAKAPADGHTIYIASVVSNTIYEALNGEQRVGLDDFEAVGGIASGPHVLVAPTALNINTVDELVAYLNKNSEKANYASMGAGTLSNLEGEIFKEQAKVKALQIPYKGSGQALPEVISGSSMFMFDSLASSLPQQEGGRINILAVASPQRLTVLPDVPTLKEVGIQGLDAENLFALMAPKDTPKDRVDALEAALNKVKADEDFRKAIGAYGFVVSDISGAGTPGFISSQRQFWKDKTRTLNITAQP